VRDQHVPYNPLHDSGLPIDRLRTLHAGRAARRPGACRPLVVGTGKQEGAGCTAPRCAMPKRAQPSRDQHRAPYTVVENRRGAGSGAGSFSRRKMDSPQGPLICPFTGPSVPTRNSTRGKTPAPVAICSRRATGRGQSAGYWRQRRRRQTRRVEGHSVGIGPQIGLFFRGAQLLGRRHREPADHLMASFAPSPPEHPKPRGPMHVKSQ
jgi:hypothetical protein